MRLTLRAKLSAIVGTAAVAFLVLIIASALVARKVDRQLADVQERLLPRVELGPRLDAQFEHLGRALQDAVAAHDAEALTNTRDIKDGILEEVAAAHGAVNPADAARMGRALENYHAAALAVSRRLLAGETGEGLVAAMSDMQAKQARAAQVLKVLTAFDRTELAHAFSTAAASQRTAANIRLAITSVCLASVILLSLWLSRGVLTSVGALIAGLKRFAGGAFDRPISGFGDDELGQVAAQANQMAASLKSLADERDRTDWLKNGQAGLSREVRGELEPEEVAGRAIQFIARVIDARVGVLYYVDDDRTLRPLGRYGVSAGDAAADSAPPSFRRGVGLVGQAASQEEILVVADPPAEYLRVRSGLGAAGPLVIVFVPILHAGDVKGVIELGLFSPWSDRARELLLTVRETLAIAMEVARARAATRQLLAETQRQAARLANQEEELRSNNEELQTQQEELRETNGELTRQTEELHAQRRMLEARNADLDHARRELESKAAELTTVSAYKSQFLANMSHELRTPLNSMLLLSNLLATNDGGNLSAKQVEYASTIHSAGRDLLALINQVLDLAKIEAGKQDVRVAPLALDDLAGALERVFTPLARDKGLRLTTTMAPGLPDVVWTDRRRVEQILNNLLANAIKFTNRGGEVTLRVRRPEVGAVLQRPGLDAARMIALEVSDTGLGIAPADQERIFAPFEQVDAAPDRRYGGTGLGLNIARELAHLLGGEIQVQSALGRGSTFTCFLPVGAASGDTAAEVDDGGSGRVVTEPPPRAAGQNGTAAPARPEGGTPADARDRSATVPRLPRDSPILIIEDDRRFAETLGEIIEGQGLTYRIAGDGRTGLRLARDPDQRPGAIILDVMLPDIDGWSVVEELRADPAMATVPVHIVSAVDAADHGARLGVVGYLTKPATERDLARMVASLAPPSPRRRPRILVVEGEGAEPADPATSVAALLRGDDVDVQQVTGTARALEVLGRERFACLIVDLSRADKDGLEFLRAVHEQCGAATPAVVVYTGRALTKAEAQLLEAHAEAVVLKEGSSTQRLLDEVRLFLRRVNDGRGRRVPDAPRLHPADVRLKGRRILIADDDMRTVYALSAMLRAKGVEVFVADTGHAALGVLADQPDIEAALMDIMMPEMDGYEAMRAIRRERRFDALPIIALTAKAMKGDEEKCIEAGATAYLAKPIDPDRLVTMLHALLPGRAHVG